MNRKPGKQDIATIAIIVFILAGIIGTIVAVTGKSTAAGPGSGMAMPSGEAPKGAPSGKIPEGAPSGFPGMSGIGGETETKATAVNTTVLIKTDIARSIRATGDVFAGSEITVYSDISGKISKIVTSEGEKVKVGQVLAYIDPSKPGEQFFNNPVTSPVTGTVTSIDIAVGDSVTTQTTIAVVSNLERLRVIADIPERYSAYLKTGLVASLEFQAFPGKIWSAEVSSVSARLNQESRSLRIELKLTDNKSSSIKAGMFADIRLTIESRENVVAVPSNIITEYDSEKYVYTVEDGQARKKTIVTGLEGNGEIEILSGLAAGETVVTKGQSFLSDGDPVSVVDMEGK